MLSHSIKNFFRLVTLAFVFSILLYACSGNDTTETKTGDKMETAQKEEATTKAPAEACSLLTEDEAKAVLGNAVTKGMSTATMCQYLSASDEMSKVGESVSIQLHPGAASEFDSYIASTEKDLNVKTKPVTGIGDKAFFAEGQLIVSKGNDFMIVIVGKKMGEEQQIAAEKNIAQKAIDRLAVQ